MSFHKCQLNRGEFFQGSGKLLTRYTLLEAGTKVELFASAKAAAKHGMKDIKRPSRRAAKFMVMIEKTRRKPNAK